MDLNHTLAGDYIKSFTYPWQAIVSLNGYITALLQLLDSEYIEIKPNVFAHKTATIAPTAYVGENTIIGAGTVVRHCAYIRGNALIGESCVVGNSTEIKNSILFDGVKVPHFNYVGDSILGYKCHMGAGAIISNVKGDKSAVNVCGKDTGLKKFGAILGDFVEIGCNSVINPGTVIGRRSSVYPLTSVRGEIGENSIVKSGDFNVTKRL
ncbi:MAG: UDP-N-acetylglucosamine pyrophosphorylase [Candidatus Coproplasma sp.]